MSGFFASLLGKGSGGGGGGGVPNKNNKNPTSNQTLPAKDEDDEEENEDWYTDEESEDSDDDLMLETKLQRQLAKRQKEHLLESERFSVPAVGGQLFVKPKGYVTHLKDISATPDHGTRSVCWGRKFMCYVSYDCVVAVVKVLRDEREIEKYQKLKQLQMQQQGFAQQQPAWQTTPKNYYDHVGMYVGNGSGSDTSNTVKNMTVVRAFRPFHDAALGIDVDPRDFSASGEDNEGGGGGGVECFVAGGRTQQYFFFSVPTDISDEYSNPFATEHPPEGICSARLDVSHTNTGSIGSIKYRPDGKRIATGTMTGAILILDSAAGVNFGRYKLLHTIPITVGHSANTKFVSWNSLGTKFATASWDGTSKVFCTDEKDPESCWKPDPNVQKMLPPVNKKEMKYVEWSANDKLIAAASYAGFVGIYKSETGTKVCDLDMRGGRCVCCRWLPGSSNLLVASDQAGAVRIWSVALQSEVFGWLNVLKDCWSISFNRDVNKHLPGSLEMACTSYDGTIHVFEFDKWPARRPLLLLRAKGKGRMQQLLCEQDGIFAVTVIVSRFLA